MLSAPQAGPLGNSSESLPLVFLQGSGILGTMALTTPASVVRIPRGPVTWETEVPV